jgi:hypothetical protein
MQVAKAKASAVDWDICFGSFIDSFATAGAFTPVARSLRVQRLRFGITNGLDKGDELSGLQF